MIDSFFISYFSNQSTEYFTENKSYKFSIYLPHESFFSRELSQKKLIVGLKSLSFQFAEHVDNPSIIGLKSSLIDQSNKTKDQIFFMTQVKTQRKIQQFSISHPLYFYTNRRNLASPSFEFTSYNTNSDKFETLTPDILRDDITVHVQVEVKAIDPSMDLHHFNVLVSSSDKESTKIFPTNKPYDFTIARRLEFPENEKWVMGLKSLIIPSLIQNADVPDFGITYKLEMIPKDKEKHLPYRESFSGDLTQKHFEDSQQLFNSLEEQWNKISKIKKFFTINEQGFKIRDPKILVYKSSLLERPPPTPPPTPPPQLPLPPSPAGEIEEFLDSPSSNPNEDNDSDLGEEEPPSNQNDNIHLFIDLPEDEDDMEVNEIMQKDVTRKRPYSNQELDEDDELIKYRKTESTTNAMEVVESTTEVDGNPCEPRKKRKKPGDRGYDEAKEKEKDEKRAKRCQEYLLRRAERAAKGATAVVEEDIDNDTTDNSDVDEEVHDGSEEVNEVVNNDTTEEENQNLNVPVEDSVEEVNEESQNLNVPVEDSVEEINEVVNNDTIEENEDEDVIMVDITRKIDIVEDYHRSEKIMQEDRYDTEVFPLTLFTMEHRPKNENETALDYRKFTTEQENKLAQRISTHTFNLYFEISKSLAKMFGIADTNRIIELSDEDIWSDYTKKFFYTPTLPTNFKFAIPQTILLNCDLVEESLVGNQKLPLLKHIFLGEKVFQSDRQYHFEFNIDQWHVVKMKNISKFNLSMTDLLGNKVSLQESQRNLPTIVELIFKRVNDDYNY